MACNSAEAPAAACTVRSTSHSGAQPLKKNARPAVHGKGQTLTEKLLAGVVAGQVAWRARHAAARTAETQAAMNFNSQDLPVMKEGVMVTVMTTQRRSGNAQRWSTHRRWRVLPPLCSSSSASIISTQRPGMRCWR